MFVTFFMSSGRCGTQWCAAGLAKNYNDLVCAVHEPLNLDYDSRHLVAGKKIDELQGAAIIKKHIETIDEITSPSSGKDGKQYIETGWPSYGAIPFFLQRYEGQIRIVHITRHPVPTASSLLTHNLYGPGREGMLEKALFLPFDKNVSFPEIADTWASMSQFEKCLYHWSELNNYALEMVKRSTAPCLQIKFEDLFGGDDTTLIKLLDFLKLPVRKPILDDRFTITDKYHFKTKKMGDFLSMKKYPQFNKLAETLGYQADDFDEASITSRYVVSNEKNTTNMTDGTPNGQSHRKRPSLATLLEIKQPIDVVDIGANPIDGEAPYQPLLDAGLAHVYGFEPNPEALARQEEMKGPNETYVPSAVFDGSEQELKVCNAQGMTSLLEPNAELLSYFHGFPEWGKVVQRLSIPTVRLDDVKEIKNIDYLKIDVQGGELEIFRNGVNRLRDCLVIHTEVEFLPMYKGQPLFSEVELFLRELGFIFHKFVPLVSRTVQPLLINNDIYKGLSQVFWADAIFIKDFTKFDQLSSESLKKLALILNDIYGSIDIVLRALMAHDTKTKSKLAEKFKQYLSGTFGT